MFFLNNGQMINENSLFQTHFPEQLWKNLRNFIHALSQLPVWKNRALASSVFSGKKDQGYWKKIFETGNTPDGAPVLSEPLNYLQMIQD